jgi:ferric-dicitrate binding protein FerR (iron transport regulator)
MGKVYQHIDFEIIWKKIHQIATEEEGQILDRWLQEDPKHREFYAKAEEYFRRGGPSELPLDIEKAWRKVRPQLGKRILTWKRIASVAAVLVFVAAGSYLYLSNRGQNPAIGPVAQTTIVPGTNQAVLILDNGSSYELSADKNISIDLGGAQVTSQGKAIEYISTGKTSNTIEYNTLKVPYGGEFYLVLSDSTQVWLNSGTTLRYPVQFTASERRVELIGEAYFQVRKDKKPFRVESHGQVVEALGTQFNVSAYSDEANVLTTLVEGKVRVSLTEHPGAQEILMPNSQSCFNKGSNNLTQYAVDASAVTAWKNGRFVFNDSDLESMMKILSRWYNVKVVFANEKLKLVRFTGDIRRYENLNTLLSFIEKTNEVKIRVEGQTVTIE